MAAHQEFADVQTRVTRQSEPLMRPSLRHLECEPFYVDEIDGAVMLAKHAEEWRSSKCPDRMGGPLPAPPPVARAVQQGARLFFLTEIDPRVKTEGARDPLGIQAVWSGIARTVISNLLWSANCRASSVDRPK